MADWYNVYHSEEYEAEIQVGLYDHWLRQLQYGPTQADRALIHTDMMEHAQERRFVVSEARLDITDFENDHSRRIGRALDHLQAHFSANKTYEVEDAEPVHDEALIGLAPVSSHDRYTDCSQFATSQSDNAYVAMSTMLKWFSWQIQPDVKFIKPTWTGDELMADASDAVEEEYNEPEKYMEAMTMTRQRSYPTTAKVVRQKKNIRLRGSVIHSATKGFKKPLSGIKDSQTE